MTLFRGWEAATRYSPNELVALHEQVETLVRILLAAWDARRVQEHSEILVAEGRAQLALNI
jgi:hypothetical protein